MTDLTKQTNHRVVVYPTVSRYINTDLAQVCKGIKADIERHVDDWDAVTIEYDMVCAHCGSPWEQPPICCAAAIRDWKEQHPEWAFDVEGNWFKAIATGGG